MTDIVKIKEQIVAGINLELEDMKNAKLIGIYSYQYIPALQVENDDGVRITLSVKIYLNPEQRE